MILVGIDEAVYGLCRPLKMFILAKDPLINKELGFFMVHDVLLGEELPEPLSFSCGESLLNDLVSL